VQNELTKAYNELRNEKSNVDYGKDFNRLNNEEQKKIKDFYITLEKTEMSGGPRWPVQEKAAEMPKKLLMQVYPARLDFCILSTRTVMLLVRQWQEVVSSS
jgi:hypothetical protein